METFLTIPGGRHFHWGPCYINRDYGAQVVANIRATGRVSSSRLLAADSANAVNTPASAVVLHDFAVASGTQCWYKATLQPHSMTTIEFAAHVAGDR
jgi:hypothetical protein